MHAILSFLMWHPNQILVVLVGYLAMRTTSCHAGNVQALICCQNKLLRVLPSSLMGYTLATWVIREVGVKE